MAFSDTPVLVIDDSKAVRTVLTDILRDLGFADLDQADSVAEGVKVFDERRHPVVFLDLLMPEASGIRFARHALDKDPYCKIVVTTALPQSNEGVITAVSEGAFDILPKPLRKEEVQRVVDRLEKAFKAVTRSEDVSYS